MKITCIESDYAHIGYVYLQPPSGKIPYQTNCILNQSMDISQIQIPFEQKPELGTYLENMTMLPYSFRSGYKQEKFETEYGVDFDSSGYITGFEVGMSPVQFLTLIENQSYRLFESVWQNQTCHIFLLDEFDSVFSEFNAICRMNRKEDAYLIIQFVQPETLGVTFYPSEGKRIALIKGLISAKPELYPLSYLLQPDFELIKDK
ncbi:hypothetical protein J23TS9_54040 [Paenibacillus sp. J23TS9]|uniref:hypothetical protein n=1 Tax=Paenibacillus sp. J23TS9 TaxID=2807193 RepID=UPI001B2AD8F9|nr:hypothetical protein [Paenibacillus sp. J23TS9]GIP30274.1 hypothetical protein J23TS9_54040 [Paenibacillus sp. J23TS9]